MKRGKGDVKRVVRQRDFAFRRADKADRKPQNTCGFFLPVRQQFQQMKQGGWGVADGYDCAFNMRLPELNCRRATGVLDLFCQGRGGRIIQGGYDFCMA